MTIPNWTHDQINQGYMDGMLPPSDARLVLLGYEGSGKSCLADTLVGKCFQDTTPTEGADQLEISITTAANWELMDKSEKIEDIEKQALLEIEFFLSSNVKSNVALSNTASFMSLPMNNNQPDEEPKVKNDDQLVVALEQSKSPPANKKFVPISTEEFQQLTALHEQYDPEKKYVHLWDFAGQQVSDYSYYSKRIQLGSKCVIGILIIKFSVITFYNKCDQI